MPSVLMLAGRFAHNIKAGSFVITVMAALVLTTSLANAEVFRWVDADGKVHYGDKVSSTVSTQSETVELHDNRANAQVTPSAGTSPTVTMYSTVWCGYCKKAKRLFEQRSVAFVELDIETNPQAKRDYKKLGGRGVPFIVIGDTTVAGYDKGRILGALEQAGL